MPIPPNPALDETISVGQTGHIHDHEVIHEALNSSVHASNTFASRPAAGNEGLYYIATWAGTTITRLYVDDGTEWTVPSDPPGTFNPLDFGADPTGYADSRDAVIDCITAANEMWTGAPSGTGTVAGEIQWTAGQYAIGGGDIELPIIQKMTGVGGSDGIFSQGKQVIISFDTGGFVTNTSQSSFTIWRGLYVMSGDGAALRANNGAGPGVFRDCTFRSRGTDDPAVQIDNAFLALFVNCSFQCKDQNDDSVSFLVNTSSPGYEGWDFEFRYCVFNNGGFRWNIADAHPGNRTYGPLIFTHCLGENYGNDNALVTIAATGTTSPRIGHIRITESYIDDSGTGVDVLRLVAESSGNLFPDQGIVIGGSRPTNSGAHLRCVELSTGLVIPHNIIFEQENPVVVWGSSAGGGAIASFARVTGDRTTAAVARYSVKTDTHDRALFYADGTLWRGYGAANPGVFDGINPGSPEGVVGSAPGGTCRDTTNGELYIKNTGTGNTGWKIVTHA